MGYARHIGRVGALAVTLGVGVAMATGVAYADPTGDSSSSGSAGDTSSAGAGSADGTSSASSPGSTTGAGSASTRTNTNINTDTAGSGPTPTGPASGSGTTGTSPSKDGDPAPAPSTDDAGTSADPSTDPADGEPPTVDTEPVPSDEPADPAPADPDPAPIAASPAKNDSAPAPAPQPSAPDATVNIAATAPAADEDTPPPVPAISTLAAPTQRSAQSTAAAVTATTTTALTAVAPVVRQPETVITVVTRFVAALLEPLLNAAEHAPIQIPILSAALSLVRNEFDRILGPRGGTAVQPVTTAVVDPTTQHVLVIGVDGTNLSRILADPDNVNFLKLMATSTTAASSIVGHTTISNPSWTSILTGVWGERTGVVNNVFTPWTYDTWPTVFNQLEALDSDIETMTVANWNVINGIAGAGALPVDRNLYVAQLEGDTDWLATDDRVAALTIDAIAGADAPNFLFSYFVGVDENGHTYGGASQQYEDAITNMDENLGAIIAAITQRENTTGEDWTIMVVTDHGHQPQVGFGHGFQSPDETETFVIVDGPGFNDGFINSAYEIVDTTPTVVSLFGGTPRAGSDGVPLQSLGAGSKPADLTAALRAAIARNASPDPLTDVLLGIRTIFTTIPYYVFEFGADAGAGLPDFLVVPVKLFFDGLYVATNVPAQIVAFLTGVTGARIFPLLPPAAPNFPPADAPVLLDTRVCAVPSGSLADARCGAASVA